MAEVKHKIGTIISGNTGSGKTCLMTHFLTEAVFDRDRAMAHKREVAQLNAGGFNLTAFGYTPAYTNYKVMARKPMRLPRKTMRINPYRLGLHNPFVETHFIPPYAVIGITEAQKYFNSRKSSKYPDWQSRWMELHRHHGLEIYMDAQRANLIDANIREIFRIVEVQECTFVRSIWRLGGIKKVTWKVREFECSDDYDAFKETRDKRFYKERTITANYNVGRNYDTKSGAPKFYNGHIQAGKDFHKDEWIDIEKTPEGYTNYLAEVDDEEPAGFYQDNRKRSTVWTN